MLNKMDPKILVAQFWGEKRRGPSHVFLVASNPYGQIKFGQFFFIKTHSWLFGKKKYKIQHFYWQQFEAFRVRFSDAQI